MLGLDRQRHAEDEPLGQLADEPECVRMEFVSGVAAARPATQSTPAILAMALVTTALLISRSQPYLLWLHLLGMALLI